MLLSVITWVSKCWRLLRAARASTTTPTLLFGASMQMERKRIDARVCEYSMSEKKEETEDIRKESEPTNIWLRRSNTGDGLNVEGIGGTTLTVSITAVRKLLDGSAYRIRFSRFKGSPANPEPLDA